MALAKRVGIQHDAADVAERLCTPRAALFALLAALCIAVSAGMLSGCAGPEQAPTYGASPDDSAMVRAAVGKLDDSLQYLPVYEPLQFDASTAQMVGSQGKAGYWGTCGECAMANTLNLALGSTYTEADMVNLVLDQGQCDTSSGGMSTNNLLYMYEELLPTDRMGVACFDGAATLSMEGLACALERGSLLNVSVYGEMMREGGHDDEGKVNTTHWLLLYGAERDARGRVSGFHLVDSASDATYITADALNDVYLGHDGTFILDPTCLEIFGWKHANGAPISEIELAPVPWE